MSKIWWGVSIGSLVLGATLIGIGFSIFDTGSFFENLMAEAIGLLLALAIIVWLIEGPVLSRQSRVRSILEYRRKVVREVVDIAPQISMEIAQLITDDFQPYIDLYGPERGKWCEFEPLLRQIFRKAMNVRQDGIPDYPRLDKEAAKSFMDGCLRMEASIRPLIDSRPEFNRWDVLGGLSMRLRQVVQHVERAKRLDLLSDPVERYVEIGELGDLLLEMLRDIDLSPESRELW